MGVRCGYVNLIVIQTLIITLILTSFKIAKNARKLVQSGIQDGNMLLTSLVHESSLIDSGIGLCLVKGVRQLPYQVHFST
jgi:hypothetical protein